MKSWVSPCLKVLSLSRKYLIFFSEKKFVKSEDVHKKSLVEEGKS